VTPDRASGRLTTGVPGLDTVLNGGLVRGSTTIVQGPPGAGKTILANQIAFHQTERGAKVVYVTLMTESHAALLRHLSGLSFFNSRVVGDSLVYLSGYDALRDSTATLLQLLQREILPRRPELLVIDAIGGITELHGVAALRQFLHELQAFIEAANCTGLVISANAQTPAAEDTVVDNIMFLHEAAIGLRVERQLRVHKSRGTPHIPGQHVFAIDANGVKVFPRIEALFRDPTRPLEEDRTRLGFDLDGLDQMLGGGFPKGSSALVLGPSGTGKTLLGLSFLGAGLKRGESAVYAGFYESPPRLISAAERIGLDLREYAQRGQLKIIWQAPVELLLDAWAHRLLDAVQGLRPTRLVVDGLNALQEGTPYTQRFAPYLTALFNELRGHGVTTVASTELHQIFGRDVAVPLPGISPLVENAILLRYAELDSRMHRVIAVLKVRGSDHATDVRAFDIGASGFQVGQRFEHVAGLLTGTAQDTGTANRKPDAG
jgi:circadian clock protein KaiC